MKLGKLLAAGKSFVGGRGESPYRANEPFYLPKFFAEKSVCAAMSRGNGVGRPTCRRLKKANDVDGAKTQKLPALPGRPGPKKPLGQQINQFHFARLTAGSGAKPQRPCAGGAFPGSG